MIGFAAQLRFIRPLPCHSASAPAAKLTRTLRYRLRGHASLFFACFSAAKRTRALRDGLRCAKQQVTSPFLAAKRTRRCCDRLRGEEGCVFVEGNCGWFWQVQVLADFGRCLDTASAVRHSMQIVFPPSISKIVKIMSDGARNQSKSA